MLEFIIYAGYAILVCTGFAIAGIALMAGMGHFMKKAREIEVKQHRENNK
jgi:hypothetical protein